MPGVKSVVTLFSNKLMHTSFDQMLSYCGDGGDYSTQVREQVLRLTFNNKYTLNVCVYMRFT